jgi:hypothetical protein
MIEKIHLQSTDGEWRPKYITAGDKYMYKILTLSKFAFYFDTTPLMLGYKV